MLPSPLRQALRICYREARAAKREGAAVDNARPAALKDAAADGKAKPGTAVLGGEIWSEESSDILL